ncbi:uncharacterized protein PAC_09160 [Phialocephala subalpina]|uniref:Uncharacterized protein n=1 Tax=Phialocephala subalpina TaxID=576137 RepID=A0A1L7X2Q3_9HELO|nr:uncharacterized protein PAC_09160 [Phialocephala subalpina]
MLVSQHRGYPGLQEIEGSRSLGNCWSLPLSSEQHCPLFEERQTPPDAGLREGARRVSFVNDRCMGECIQMGVDGHCDHFSEKEMKSSILGVKLELAIARTHFGVSYDKALGFSKDVMARAMDFIFDDQSVQPVKYNSVPWHIGRSWADMFNLGKKLSLLQRQAQLKGFCTIVGDLYPQLDKSAMYEHIAAMMNDLYPEYAVPKEDDLVVQEEGSYQAPELDYDVMDFSFEDKVHGNAKEVDSNTEVAPRQRRANHPARIEMVPSRLSMKKKSKKSKKKNDEEEDSDIVGDDEVAYEDEEVMESDEFDEAPETEDEGLPDEFDGSETDVNEEISFSDEFEEEAQIIVNHDGGDNRDQDMESVDSLVSYDWEKQVPAVEIVEEKAEDADKEEEDDSDAETVDEYWVSQRPAIFTSQHTTYGFSGHPSLALRFNIRPT